MWNFGHERFSFLLRWKTFTFAQSKCRERSSSTMSVTQLSELRRTLAKRGSCCRCSRRTRFVRQLTKPMTSTVVDRPLMSRWRRLLGAIPRPFSCMPNPRSWWMIRRRRRASNGWARSTMRWWCHCGPRCANACRHSNPTTRLCSPCRLMCRASHRERRWRCSSIRCVRSGSTLACSWSSSRPWRCDPNRLKTWENFFRIERWSWKRLWILPETMIGLTWFGEKRTHETQSLCPSSWMVYLHSAKVFHNLMVLSRDPETIWRLSAEKATERTS